MTANRSKAVAVYVRRFLDLMTLTGKNDDA